MSAEEFENIFGNVPFEDIKKIQKYIQENYIPKDKIKKYLKEEQERFEVYKRESKTYVKNSENITAEMNNDINKLLSEISKKDKIIDLILKEQIEDGYLVNFHNLEEARKYYEDRI